MKPAKINGIQLADSILRLTDDQIALGAEWWAQARREVTEIATFNGLPVERLLWAAAALTPGVGWDGTLTNLMRLITAFRDGRTHIPYNIEAPLGWMHAERAWEVITTDRDAEKIVNGMKVEAFAANLMGDMNRVTVDRHIVRLAGCNGDRTPSPALYQRIELHVRLLAAIRGGPPAHVMAALWLQWRDGAR